jgi:hypothetical protein
MAWGTRRTGRAAQPMGDHGAELRLQHVIALGDRRSANSAIVRLVRAPCRYSFRTPGGSPKSSTSPWFTRLRYLASVSTVMSTKGLCDLPVGPDRDDPARVGVLPLPPRRTDPRFLRYPPLPVLRCPGYEGFHPPGLWTRGPPPPGTRSVPVIGVLVLGLARHVVTLLTCRTPTPSRTTGARFSLAERTSCSGSCKHFEALSSLSRRLLAGHQP